VASSSSIIKSRSDPTKEALKLVVLDTVVDAAEDEADDDADDVSTGFAEAEAVVGAEGKTDFPES